MNTCDSKLKKKVFVSYAREDIGEAKRIYNDLRKEGINPWMDSEDLLPGQKWKNEIINEIKESDYFLLLLSKNSISKDGYIQKEQKTALELADEHPDDKIYIIPIRIEDCEPSNQKLQALHWVDLFNSYEKGINKIIQVIKPIEEEIPDELDLYINKLIELSKLNISKFEKRAKWGDNYSLILKEFDGDEFVYIFWDNREKKLTKCYRSYSGTSWYKGYRLDQQDKRKIREILNIE